MAAGAALDNYGRDEYLLGMLADLRARLPGMTEEDIARRIGWRERCLDAPEALARGPEWEYTRQELAILRVASSA